MKVDFDYLKNEHTLHLETDEELIDYSDYMIRNREILDEIEHDIIMLLSNSSEELYYNPSDYLFFLKDYFENERKDNV